MSHHLPECGYGIELSFDGAVQPAEPCCCDQLRACEQRVLLSKPNIELSAVYGYEAGRSDGLDAARDAVAALPCMAGRGQDRHPRHVDDFKDAVLAAIDALRANADTSTDDGARRVPMQNLPKETP